MGGQLAIGIDLGGTNVRIAVISASGDILRIREQLTHAEREMAVIVESIAQGVQYLLDDLKLAPKDVVGIGLGAPGFLSLASGVILSSPNLPTALETPVVSLMRRFTGLPVYLENDANAAAIGEHWKGAGRGSRNLLCITLGTGVGSGFILGGTIWHGSSDLAGELGHTTLVPEGLPCRCGRNGCLEAYVSATGIVTRTRLALQAGRPSTLTMFREEDYGHLTSRSVYEHAQRGDRLAREVFEETGSYLAVALTNVLNTLDLETIILGGQVMQAGALLLTPTIHGVEKRAIRSRYYPTTIVRAQLGNHAGIMGAARTAFDLGDSSEVA